MGFYLDIEVDSLLSPFEFRERVIVPLGEVLEREGMGRILDNDPEDEPVAEGKYQLALEVVDQKRAREIVEEVLAAVDG